MNDLTETIKMMASSDYKDRFLAEYWQLVIRINKLSLALDSYEHGTLNFKFSSPVVFLYSQLAHMISYKNILEQRAIVEKIELNGLTSNQEKKNAI